jgi:hypothetical protein
MVLTVSTHLWTMISKSLELKFNTESNFKKYLSRTLLLKITNLKLTSSTLLTKNTMAKTKARDHSSSLLNPLYRQ